MNKREQSNRQAGEIEITPEMIEAGAKAAMNFYPGEWGGLDGIQEPEAKLLAAKIAKAILGLPALCEKGR